MEGTYMRQRNWEQNHSQILTHFPTQWTFELIQSAILEIQFCYREKNVLISSQSTARERCEWEWKAGSFDTWIICCLFNFALPRLHRTWTNGKVWIFIVIFTMTSNFHFPIDFNATTLDFIEFVSFWHFNLPIRRSTNFQFSFPFIWFLCYENDMKKFYPTEEMQ